MINSFIEEQPRCVPWGIKSSFIWMHYTDEWAVYQEGGCKAPTGKTSRVYIMRALACCCYMFTAGSLHLICFRGKLGMLDLHQPDCFRDLLSIFLHSVCISPRSSLCSGPYTNTYSRPATAYLPVRKKAPLSLWPTGLHDSETVLQPAFWLFCNHTFCCTDFLQPPVMLHGLSSMRTRRPAWLHAWIFRICLMNQQPYISNSYTLTQMRTWGSCAKCQLSFVATRERLGDLPPKHTKDNSPSMSYSVLTVPGFTMIIIELVD